MKSRKTLSIALLLVGALVAGSLVANCSHQKTKAPAAAAPKQPAPVALQLPPVPEIPKAPLTVSVDFDKVPLSDVALFVTGKTGKGFILNGTNQTPITWIEYRMPKEKVFDSFTSTLTAFGLALTPTSEAHSVYTITPVEEAKVAYKLNFAASRRGVFFLLGNTVYPKDKFPYSLRYDGRQWFAMLPQSFAAQLDQPTGHPVTTGVSSQYVKK